MNRQTNPIPLQAQPLRLANRRDFLSRAGMGFALLGLRDVMAGPRSGLDLPDPLAPTCRTLCPGPSA